MRYLMVAFCLVAWLTACGGNTTGTTDNSGEIETAVATTTTAEAAEPVDGDPTATPREESEASSTPGALAWNAILDYQEVGVPLPKTERLFGGGIYVPSEAHQDIQTAVFGDELQIGAEVYFPNNYDGQTPERLADGTNIEQVTFDVAGPEGLSVYQYTDDAAPYCLFGDEDGTCTPYSFSENNCVWPDGDTPMQSGFQTLSVTLVGVDGESENWLATLDIQNTECAGNGADISETAFDVFGCCNDAGQRNDDVLSAGFTAFTTGYLALDIELNDACSDARFYISVDGSEVAVSDFIGSESGSTRTDIIELGQYLEGEHAIRISPEGREGGCNVGTLNSWVGVATVYFSQ